MLEIQEIYEQEMKDGDRVRESVYEHRENWFLILNTMHY